MDQQLLRSYFSAIYEFPSAQGMLRVSLDGDVLLDTKTLPDLLQKPFSVLTAFNPRSMLLPRKVNEGRNQVLRDMLILGCYRVESCVSYEDVPDSSWREASWLVHSMDREEAISFGRVFRQNAILVCNQAKPEIIVTDPTCDDVGKTFVGNWRLRM